MNQQEMLGLLPHDPIPTSAFHENPVSSALLALPAVDMMEDKSVAAVAPHQLHSQQWEVRAKHMTATAGMHVEVAILDGHKFRRVVTDYSSSALFVI